MPRGGKGTGGGGIEVLGVDASFAPGVPLASLDVADGLRIGRGLGGIASARYGRGDGGEKEGVAGANCMWLERIGRSRVSTVPLPPLP